MKKNILTATAVALIATASIFTGCKKDDTTAPVITLNGASPVTVSLQGTYTEQNATATDDVDGTVTPTVTGSVNVNQKGEYTLTYTATDKAGNSSTTTRKVNVVNDADAWAGSYSCTIAGSTPYVYTQTITTSETVNNRLHFSKFAGYTGASTIYVDVTGVNITLPSQTAIQVGSPAADRMFAGTGSTSGSTTINLNYTETTNGTNLATVEALVKQ